jgi:peptidoglycan/xylan/chitin deacetylase (PgdA/CDA1 family)
MPRRVVFTGDLSYAVRAGIVEIDRIMPDLAWLVVIHSPRPSLPALLRNQRRNLLRNGWRWIPYQMAEVVRRVIERPPPPVAKGAPGYEATIDTLGARPNVRIQTVADIHTDTTLATIRTFAPDLGLSLAAPILRAVLFSIPRLGTLNLHKGRVPHYRGMPPAFWELWHGENQVGCTVHHVDAKLDTGDVVCETAIERERFSTLRGLQLRLDQVGIELTRRAVVETLRGTSAATPQAQGGTTNRKPTLRQIAQLERRLARHAPVGERLARRVVKETVHAGASTLWNPVLRSLVRPRITVILYHRVSDDARDNLTVGIGQFDRQMALLRRLCRPMAIDELLALDVVPRSDRPQVCVTFDDGYLDNYVHAMPILMRHGIPAAFFVSTGIIATQRPFPHDVSRGNALVPSMNWEQVQALHERGFTIGSHSVTHIDCAAEPEAVVVHELAQSLADLRRRLGLVDVYFAYPFGGREHMTPQRLELVKKAGYAACLSAYGGTNAGRIDPFNVLRGGIHWEFSDRAFLFRCMGFA